jgi:hypothetical protein
VFLEPQSNWQLLSKALGTPETAWPDFISFVRGDVFSMEALWPELQRYDARERHARLEEPERFGGELRRVARAVGLLAP